MSIETLSKKEELLLSRMPEKGSFEEKHKYLLDSGLYEEWRAVFDDYVELALKGNEEALKRAIFFLWYETCEPAPLSGLLDLDRGNVISTVEYLNTQLGQGNLGSELSWMLPYYYQVTEWYLPKETSVELILAASKGDSDAWRTNLSKANFINRGQLGDYWCSIQL